MIPVPVTSKIGSQPKFAGPRAGTIFPSVAPSNIMGSLPGSQYANVHKAVASVFEKPRSIAFKPNAHVGERHQT